MDGGRRGVRAEILPSVTERAEWKRWKRSQEIQGDSVEGKEPEGPPLAGPEHAEPMRQPGRRCRRQCGLCLGSLPVWLEAYLAAGEIDTREGAKARAPRKMVWNQTP